MGTIDPENGVFNETLKPRPVNFEIRKSFNSDRL